MRTMQRRLQIGRQLCWFVLVCKLSEMHRRIEENNVQLAAAVAVWLILRKRKKRRERVDRSMREGPSSHDRSCWVKSWLARQEEQGIHHNLFLELQLEDPMKYRRCLRLSTDMFETLLAKVSPMIERQNTHLRKSISAAERLSVTLRHLATGESQESLQMYFRIDQSTISGIIRETAVAIHCVLKDEFLKPPATHEEWKALAHDAYMQWNFPNCVGAMDGKHFVIQHPLNSGSMYYNYKETFSVVLLAVVDAQLRFTLIDVGANGRASDRGIWGNSSIKKAIEAINIPRSPLPNTDVLFPYVLVGDEGFSLSEHLMIPYPKNALRNRVDRRIFNYRLSRFRRCSENAFGTLAARFQIFCSPMRYDPDTATSIIQATLALHNWLRTDTTGQAMYTPGNSVDCEDIENGRVVCGDWREVTPGAGVLRLENQGGNRHPTGALELRNTLCAYFNGPGAVPWQDKMVGA